jgi:hypothetical protein
MKKLLFLVIAIIMSGMSITVGCGEPEPPTTTTPTTITPMMITPTTMATGLNFILKFDEDGDGKVSYEEYPVPSFVLYDRNSDGFIVLDEAPVPKTEPSAAQIAFIVKYDADEDGKVSYEEFPRPHFPYYDYNGDGFIEPIEAPGAEAAY